MFSHVLPLMSLAFRILKTRRDPDLIEKLTVVRGYSQLLDEEPNNLTFQRRLRKATEELRMLVHVQQLDMEVVDPEEPYAGTVA